MTNDIEMLNCVLQNAEMGCQGITSVRKSLQEAAISAESAATKATVGTRKAVSLCK